MAQICMTRHQPVNLAAIRKIDRDQWDRKGIARIHYQVPGNARLAVVVLDDFIYDRKPTDLIFDRICAVVEPAKSAGLPAVQ